MSELADDIASEFGIDHAHPKSSAIPRERVLQWMKSGDLEAMGAVYAFIMKETYASRIIPPLSFEDYRQFLLDYYDRCLKADPKGTWATSRYGAGWDLTNWFRHLWNERKARRDAVKGLKDWLAGLYRAGDSELRRCIETATLEHLFEDREVVAFFSDWKEDDVLGKAYARALEWPGR
jgi:hypothetical protein